MSWYRIRDLKQFLIPDYFLEETKNIAPPTTITPIPISGDQDKWWGSLEVILRLPISTTFSLVKKVIAVKMVNAKPRIRINIPAFFILFNI